MTIGKIEQLSTTPVGQRISFATTLAACVCCRHKPRQEEIACGATYVHFCGWTEIAHCFKLGDIRRVWICPSCSTAENIGKASMELIKS